MCEARKMTEEDRRKLRLVESNLIPKFELDARLKYAYENMESLLKEAKIFLNILEERDPALADEFCSILLSKQREWLKEIQYDIDNQNQYEEIAGVIATLDEARRERYLKSRRDAHSDNVQNFQKSTEILVQLMRSNMNSNIELTLRKDDINQIQRLLIDQLQFCREEILVAASLDEKKSYMIATSIGCLLEDIINSIGDVPNDCLFSKKEIERLVEVTTLDDRDGLAQLLRHIAVINDKLQNRKLQHKTNELLLLVKTNFGDEYVKSLFTQELNAFISEREPHQSVNLLKKPSILDRVLRFFRNSKDKQKIEINAAKKVRELIEKPERAVPSTPVSTIFNSEEYNALHTGKLGKIMNRYKSLGLLPRTYDGSRMKITPKVI